MGQLSAFLLAAWVVVPGVASFAPTLPQRRLRATILREDFPIAQPPSVSLAVFSSELWDDPPDDCRRCLLLALSLTLLPGGSATTEALAKEGIDQVTVPLRWNGDAYLVYYRVGGDLFRAVLDTGSPFLTVPGTCDAVVKSRWGCYREQGVPSGLPPTTEIFDGNEGEVQWRSAPFSFVNATGSMIGPPLTTFGVVSQSLMVGPGGVFFGLLRDTDKRIRPSFLGQTDVCAFKIDLASETKTLTLSNIPLINPLRRGDAVPLVSDLRRKYGDPNMHYVGRVRSIQVNGTPLNQSESQPIYAIFDSGVTGMVVSQDLFNNRYADARRMREKSLWGDVSVSFRTISGGTVELQASSPITTPLTQTPWRGRKVSLIVLGLSFLENNQIIIDIDQEELLIETGGQIN